MRYALGRALEIIGLAIVPIGLLAAFAYRNSTNAIKYEIACLVVGGLVFYAGHMIRRKGESA